MLRDSTSALLDSTQRAPWLAAASAIVAVAIGSAIQRDNGLLNTSAIALLAFSLLVLLTAVLVQRPASSVGFNTRILPLLCGIGLAVQIAQTAATLPGTALQLDAPFRMWFTLGLTCLGCAGALLVHGVSRRWLALTALAFVGVHFLMGLAVIRHSPGTFIDVAVFQRDSVQALAHGINPYTLTFPNIYNDARFYAPGAAVNGRLAFGFPYFPLSLLVTMPAALLTGDHRYTSLLALELAALLMIYARPGAFGACAAVLYLTSPRVFFVLEQSWTEPIVVLGLAGVVVAACRDQRLVPWLFGAFIALKQYLVFALPAAWLLIPGPRTARAALGFFLKGALVATAITLPFFLWNIPAFMRSVVTLQFRQPFRQDAMTFLAWWTAQGYAEPSSAIGFAVATVAALLGLWRLPRTAAGFAGTLSLTFLCFFAFNKQAFANYYFFVIGALCLTLATAGPLPVPTAERSTAITPEATVLRPRTRAEWLALIALCAAALVPLLWIDDAPFINDEPLLISAALHANAVGQLVDRGLMGTFGFAYGPLPTWMYQLLIGLSHDLVVVATIHTALMVGTTAFALWWLSRSLGLWAWFAPVPLLSPYFWFYTRALWDNPLLIPLGALAVAGYAAFLATESRAGLRVAVASMMAIPLVHLMGLAFVAPLAAHMLLFRWRGLWALRASLTTIVSAGAIAAWPYWLYLLTAQPPGAGTSGPLRGAIFPLLGGRLLSSRGLEYFYGTGPIRGALMQSASTASWIGYALVWIGIAVALSMIVNATRRRLWTPRGHLALVLVATVACQIALDSFSGKFEHPHYQNATWMAFVVLAWLAIDWMAARRSPLRWSAPLLAGTLAAALLVAVGTLAIRLHRTHGTRETYGPTLGNQQAVARRLARYHPQSELTTDVVPYRLFPHAITTWRELTVHPYESAGRRVTLEIRYASTDLASGTIELVER